MLRKRGFEYQIDMHLKKNSPKGIAINKIPIRKASELFGIVHFVFFFSGGSRISSKTDLPEEEDLSIWNCRQLDKVYLSNLSNYNRVINQRNSLLKEHLYTGES